MSDHGSPMTGAALVALLRFDAARHAQPAAKARVARRIETTLGALSGAPAQSSSSSSVEHGARSSAGDSALVSQTRAARPRSSLRATWSLAGKPVGSIIAAVFLGGVGGAGLYAALAPPRERTFYVERPVAVSEPRPFAFDPFPRVSEALNRDPETVESSKVRGNPAPVVSALAAERALLDRARKALARSDTAEAERALELHVRRHPAGLLLEEREALAIKMMVDTGRADEARRRAVKFKDRYPRSLFGPAVDEAIGTIR